MNCIRTLVNRACQGEHCICRRANLTNAVHAGEVMMVKRPTIAGEELRSMMQSCHDLGIEVQIGSLRDSVAIIFRKED